MARNIVHTSLFFLEKYPVDFLVYQGRIPHIEIINPHFSDILSCISDELVRLRAEGYPTQAAEEGCFSQASRNWYRSVIDNIYEPVFLPDTLEFSFLMRGHLYTFSSGSGYSYISLRLPPLWSAVRNHEEARIAKNTANNPKSSLYREIDRQDVFCRIEGHLTEPRVTLLREDERRGSSKAHWLRKILR